MKPLAVTPFIQQGIPPFLILYFPGNANTRAQARRLESVLKEADQTRMSGKWHLAGKPYHVMDSGIGRIIDALKKTNRFAFTRGYLHDSKDDTVDRIIS